MMAPNFDGLIPLFLGIGLLGVFDLVMKGFALWRASKNNQGNWFVVLLIFNTAGILPIIYLKFFAKKQK